jgi:hypothetical protein
MGNLHKGFHSDACVLRRLWSGCVFLFKAMHLDVNNGSDMKVWVRQHLYDMGWLKSEQAIASS